MHIATKCCWESHHVAPFSRNSCTYCIPLQRNLGITGLHVATIVCTPVHRCAWPPLAVAKFVLQSTFSCDLHLQDRQISAVVVTCTINNPSIFCAVKLAHYNLVTVQVVGRWCHIGLAVLKNVRWCSWCCAQEAFHFLFLQLQVRFENSVKAAEKKNPVEVEVDLLWSPRETDWESLTSLSACAVRAHRVGGDNLHRQCFTETPSELLAVCCVTRKTSRRKPQGKMENEYRRKMKEKLGLRRDIFKEFLAEFLGIFFLIVSTSLCTCHPA